MYERRQACRESRMAIRSTVLERCDEPLLQITKLWRYTRQRYREQLYRTLLYSTEVVCLES